MIGSFKAEWRKLRKRPAVLVSAGLLLGVLVLIGYLVPYVTYTHAAIGYRSDTGLTAAQSLSGLYPLVFVQHGLGGIFPIGSAVALVFGALVAGSEYSWGTLKAVFTQRPSRLETLAGRAVAIAAGLGLMTVAYWVVAAAGSVLVAVVQGHAIAWPSAVTILGALGATWLILGVWSVIGMGLAFLTRSAPAAIGIGVAYLLAIEALAVRFFLPLGGDLTRTVEKFLPGPNVSAIINSFGTAVPIKTSAPLVDAWQGVAVLALYLVVIGGLAAAVVRRRDLV
jgi:ABC-2 type transport system permease protein